MTVLDIQGRRVEVSDDFLQLSPEEQAATVDEIAQSFSPEPSQPADMSFGGRVRDNLVGTDDGVYSVGERTADLLNKAGESLTLGVVGDEAAAAADTMMGRGPYGERLEVRRAQEQRSKEAMPALTMAAEIAPALVPGMQLAKGAQVATSVGGAALRGMRAGAVAGGTYSALEGEGGAGERAAAGATGAIAGGLFGGAASGGFAAASSVPRYVRSAFTRSEKRPTLDTLKAAKTNAYRAVDRSGEKFSGEETKALYDNVAETFMDSNYVEDVDNASRAVLKILERNAGKELSLGQLDKVRRGLWGRYKNGRDQPHILDAIRAVDDLIESRDGASEMMSVARAANSRYAKAQLLDDALTKATDQTASTGSGGNTLNKYRQAVTAILNNPTKAKFFTQQEVDVMRSFVRGDVADNSLRLIGKMSPSGNGLMLALHTIGGVSTGGATVPLMVVGEAAKRGADSRALRKVEGIQDLVAGRTQPSGPPVAIGGPATATAPLADDAQGGLRRRLARRP